MPRTNNNFSVRVYGFVTPALDKKVRAYAKKNKIAIAEAVRIALTDLTKAVPATK